MKTNIHLMFLLSFCVVLWLPCVSAWGNQTYVYVCDNAVKYAWGSDVLKTCIYNQTLSFQKSFCDVIASHVGTDAAAACAIETSVVHPAVMPQLFFDDAQYHYDYTSCPIHGEIDARYLCSMEKSNPAFERFLKWVNVSQEAGDVCTRVYSFCIASNYMADTANPFNHVLYGIDKGGCAGFLNQKVENRLFEPFGWSVSQVCNFRYNQELTGPAVSARYTQGFVISNKTFVDLVQNLTFYASALSQLPLKTTTTSIPGTGISSLRDSTTTTTEVTTTTGATTTTTLPPTTIPGTGISAPDGGMSQNGTSLRSSTTTLAEASDGGSMLLAVIIVVVLAVVAFLIFKGSGSEESGKESRPVRIGSRTGRRPGKHSLQSEEQLSEGIIPADRKHSTLGRIGTDEKQR